MRRIHGTHTGFVSVFFPLFSLFLFLLEDLFGSSSNLPSGGSLVKNVTYIATRIYVYLLGYIPDGGDKIFRVDSPGRFPFYQLRKIFVRNSIKQVRLNRRL